MNTSFGKAEKVVKLEEGERYDFGNLGGAHQYALAQA